MISRCTVQNKPVAAMSTEDIAVIGAGSYGTCLAMLFGNAGHRVSLYCRNAEQAVELETTRLNKTYLPSYRLPDAVNVTSDLESSVRGRLRRRGVRRRGAKDRRSEQPRYRACCRHDGCDLSAMWLAIRDAHLAMVSRRLHQADKHRE